VQRVLLFAARFFFPGGTAAPGWPLVAATIDQATPRMLPMISDGRIGSGFARALVRLANRRHRPRRT